MRKIFSHIIPFTFNKINFYPIYKNVHFNSNISALLNFSAPLQKVKEVEQIKDFDDPYGLDYIENHKLILSHLSKSNFKYDFNDLTYFLKRISELNQKFRLDLEKQRDVNFNKLIKEIKNRLVNSQHEKYPFIGSYAFYLKQLNVQDDELWTLLANKIDSDEFYPNFKETVFACEGFTMLKKQELIDKIYPRIERNICLTIWEVNMTYYKRIATALAQVNRNNDEVFWKLENHVLNNLSMDYNTETLIDILFAFAKCKKGTRNFYDSMQYVLFKGHMFNKPFLEYQFNVPFNGTFASKLCEIYNEASHRFENFKIEPNFRLLLFKVLINKKTYYEIEDVNRVLKNIDFLIFEDIKEINGVLFHKIVSENRNKISIESIMEFYDLLNSKNLMKQLPKNVVVHFENYFKNNLRNHSLHEIHQFYDYLYQQNLIEDLNEVNINILEHINSNFMHLPSAVMELLLSKIRFTDGKLLENTEYKQMNDFVALSKFNNILEGDKNQKKMLP